MAEKKTYLYDPDYAVPPGETLAETLEHLGVSQADLARRTGLHQVTINKIIHEGEPITPETALKLETVLDVPARLWNNLEKNYRERLARLDQKERLREDSRWIREIGIPVGAMVKEGEITRHEDEADTNREVFEFLGVASREAFQETYAQWAVSFRKSAAFECAIGALAVWLRRGEIRARDIKCEPFDKADFRAMLESVRSLSRGEPSDYLIELREQCARSGVALAYTPGLPKFPVWGTSRWLSKDKALIQLSGRYRKDDHFWFSFYHEAGHILLHGKKLVFLDGKDRDVEGRDEEQANRFAMDMLIPRADLREIKLALERQPPIDDQAALIQESAKKLGIAPGIVVGRLQYEDLVPFRSSLNRLKRDVVVC